MKTKVLVLVGPTASGKSALAVHLAKKLNGEIISADSRQVYKGLDIGTGKVTKNEMGGVPHHLLDVATPKKVFNADDFSKLAGAKISEISGRGKLPIIVGGTGFYIDALVGRIALTAVAPNSVLRKKLESKSVTQLYSMIEKLDPKRAMTLSTPSERNNKVRLIRAIEIASSKTPIFTPRVTLGLDALWVGICPSDAILRKSINTRLSERLHAGMITEARRLHSAGLSYKRMNELGLEYRSLALFLQKKITRAELEAELQGAIWKYAKRQITYWKRNKDIKWFDPKGATNIEKRVRTWLKK